MYSRSAGAHAVSMSSHAFRYWRWKSEDERNGPISATLSPHVQTNLKSWSKVLLLCMHCATLKSSSFFLNLKVILSNAVANSYDFALVHLSSTILLCLFQFMLKALWFWGPPILNSTLRCKDTHYLTNKYGAISGSNCTHGKFMA